MVEHITKNENIVVVSTILMIIMAFIIFILLLKQYLRNTSEIIINMQPTVEGKKERIKYIIKTSLELFIGTMIISLIREMDSVIQGIWVFVQSLLENMIIGFIIIIILAIMYYISLEKKVKELNND